MTGMIAQLLAWPTLSIALLVFGFAPGVVLRLIVLFYPRGHLRRRELLGELYAVPRIERPFWVVEQLEIALFEGLRDRARAWLLRRKRTEIDEQGSLRLRISVLGVSSLSIEIGRPGGGRDGAAGRGGAGLEGGISNPAASEELSRE